MYHMVLHLLSLNEFGYSMTKRPTVTTLQSGFNSTETLNTNFEALRDGFDNTLSLDGSTPNAMEADLDLNGNNIIGAAGLLINGTDYLADVTAAKAAALVAQAAAETAETNAETAETNAESSETAAGLSATASATSATAADASAVDATNNGAAQVNLAANQVTLAETAKTAAELAETNAETAESNASASATSATSSASTASTGASTATTKASEAATSATNAATSATESETAKTAAEAARDAALAALDNFDDRYLGAKASAPTVDNDGNALIVGALYFNTGTDKLYIWNGTAWQVTTSGGASGDLISTNNLSDVTSASTSRTNLGLVTVASTGAYSDLTGTPTLGTAAATASTDYATAAQGTLAASAVQPNDSPTFDGLTVDGAATGEVLIKAADNAETTFPLVIENSANSLDLGIGAYGLDNTIGVSTGSDFKMNVGRELIMRSDDKTYFKMGTGGDISFFPVAGGGTAGFFWDASTERLGIGTSSPSYTLDVQGTGDTIARIYTGGTTSSDDAMLFLGIAGTTATNRINFGDAGDADAGRIIYGHSGDYMSFTTAASEAMRITSAGSVGIGTTSPTSLLDVVSSGTTAETIAEFGNASVNDGLSIETNGNLEWGFGTKNSRSMTFSTNQTERMRINGSGNVGIGTSNPSTDLDVAGGIRSTSSGGYNQITTTSIGDAVFNNNGNNWLTVKDGVPSNTMRIDNTGNVGIGKTNPATPLDVNGTVTATAFAGDGSGLTNVSASTTYGAVGTYGLFYRASAGQNAPATTTAGSNLVPANTYTHSTTWGGYSGSGSPSGTWRLMGQTGYYNNTLTLSRLDLYTSVYVRIS